MMPQPGRAPSFLPVGNRCFFCVAVFVLFACSSWAATPLHSPPQRQMVGGSRAISVVPDVTRTPLTRGRARWTSRVEIPQAGFLKPHFVDVNLRPGDVLIVRDANGEVVEEISGRGPKNAGTFWGLSAFGNTLALEWSFTHTYATPPFRIDQVIIGDADILTTPSGGAPQSICGGQSDFEEAICYQSDATKWANVRASVGVMTVGGDPTSPDPNVGLWCSGVNISPDNLVLTNQHCIQNQTECNNAEFVFKFRRIGCTPNAPTTTWKSYRCNAVVLSSPFLQCDPDLNNLDFSVQSVIGDPAATFGYTTPDPTPITSGEQVYIIQHPEGRPQEIAHGGGADFVVDEVGLRYFGSLDTEGGSSGAPIFRETNDKLVGLHQCGGCASPGVGNRGIGMADMYPLLAPFLCTTAPTLAGVEGIALQEVHGNGNSAMEPGETWQFTPRIRNTSCSAAATDVVAYVGVHPASQIPITLLDTRVSFGTVPAGRTISAQVPVRFQLGATVPCHGRVLLDLVQIVAASGGPFPDTPKILAAAIGARTSTTLLFEDFSTGIPATWTIGNRGTSSGPKGTWTTTNPGRRTLGLTAPFAIADSDAIAGQTMDERLVSPVVDTTGFAHVTLQFSHIFNWHHLGFDERSTVAVRSSATGNKWITVARFGPGDASGVERIDLTAQAAGQPDVRVRFRYANAIFERWWAIDDIFLLADHGAVCQGFALSGKIFADSFESGNLRLWSRMRANNRTDLMITAAAALAGTTQGLQLTVNDLQPVYLQDNSPDGEPRYRVRFYFDPHGMTMPDPSRYPILSLFDADHPVPKVLTVRLRFRHGRYWLSVLSRLDDNSWAIPSYFPLSPGPHFVEIDWAKASGPGANDGWTTLWIDNVKRATLQNLDNDERVVDFMRLGALSTLPAGIMGTMYFDHVVTRRQSFIGP